MKTKDELFLQLWIQPVKDGLLNILGPEELHTLIGLSPFINKLGWCNPSLNTLKNILGLKDISSVSRRIKKLEKLEFEGNLIIKVERKRKLNDKGILVYARNEYILNQTIVTIFMPSVSSTVRRIKQMKELTETRSNLIKSFGVNTKRVR